MFGISKKSEEKGMVISTSTARRANDALMAGKTLDDYDLPVEVKVAIRNRRRLTVDEINTAWTKAVRR